MAPTRDKWKLVGPCLNLFAGLCWLFVAFLKFDRLSGLHFRGDGVLLPCVAGLLFLVSAVLGVRNWLQKPEVEQNPLWPRL